jgi:hypothetical protein
MTIKLRLFLALSLFAVLLASACTSAATEDLSQPLVDIPSPTPEVAIQPPMDLTATPPVIAQPVATSRGPDLEATDATTVSLASGHIQFVEFFRFT